jgi:hypothetical protein
MDILELTDEEVMNLIEKNCVEAGISDEEKINSIIVWTEKTLLNATYLSLLNKQIIRIAGVDSLKEPIFESNEKNHLLRNSFSTKR